MILLDTNILIEYLKGNKSIIEPYPFEELFINDIVVMELYQGARSKSDLNKIKGLIYTLMLMKITMIVAKFMLNSRSIKNTKHKIINRQ